MIKQNNYFNSKKMNQVILGSVLAISLLGGTSPCLAQVALTANNTINKAPAEGTNFCRLSSKLDKIIQEQGKSQLGISQGSASSPDCRPLTLDELKRLDFSKFDMSELFEDLASNASKTPSDNEAELSLECGQQLKSKTYYP